MFIHTTSDSKNTRAAVVKPQTRLFQKFPNTLFSKNSFKSGSRAYLSVLDKIRCSLNAGRSQN